MTIYYCDWAIGDDTSGSGTATSPWKTIDKATTSRSPGDEVRVGKSPSPTALTGTSAWTLNSTTVTGTNTLFLSQLVSGDYISAPDGLYYEILGVYSNINLELKTKYLSASTSGYSSTKLNVTGTGEGLEDNAVQLVNSSGSASAYLYISGGWDLSTQTQTGQTYFRNITLSDEFGTGLYVHASYTHISRLHFLDYSFGIQYDSAHNNILVSPICTSNMYGIAYIGSNNNTCTSPICNSNGYGIMYDTAHRNTCTSPICNSNNITGIMYGSSSNNTCTSPVCNSNGDSGISLGGTDNRVSDANCNSNGSYGISFYRSCRNILISPTCNSNSSYGICYSYSAGNIIYGTLSTSSNTLGAIYHLHEGGYNYITKASLAESTKVGGFLSYSEDRVYINDMSGYSYVFTPGGNIVSQDATAGGTGKEWKLSPTSAVANSTFPLSLSVAQIPVENSGQVTFTCYFKKSSTGVAGALRCRYGQVAWSDASEDKIVNCPDNTNRNQVTLQFTPTEAGVVEIEALAWYVSSTTDSVIIDDVFATQA